MAPLYAAIVVFFISASLDANRVGSNIDAEVLEPEREMCESDGISKARRGNQGNAFAFNGSHNSASMLEVGRQPSDKLHQSVEFAEPLKGAESFKPKEKSMLNNRIATPFHNDAPPLGQEDDKAGLLAGIQIPDYIMDKVLKITRVPEGGVISFFDFEALFPHREDWYSDLLTEKVDKAKHLLMLQPGMIVIVTDLEDSSVAGMNHVSSMIRELPNPVVLIPTHAPSDWDPRQSATAQALMALLQMGHEFKVLYSYGNHREMKAAQAVSTELEFVEWLGVRFVAKPSEEIWSKELDHLIHHVAGSEGRLTQHITFFDNLEKYFQVSSCTSDDEFLED